MAKSKAREYCFLQCTSCSALNYRTEIRVTGAEATKKLNLSKFCPVERKHTEHKMKKK